MNTYISQPSPQMYAHNSCQYHQSQCCPCLVGESSVHIVYDRAIKQATTKQQQEQQQQEQREQSKPQCHAWQSGQYQPEQDQSEQDQPKQYQSKQYQSKQCQPEQDQPEQDQPEQDQPEQNQSEQHQFATPQPPTLGQLPLLPLLTLTTPLNQEKTNNFQVDQAYLQFNAHCSPPSRDRTTVNDQHFFGECDNDDGHGSGGDGGDCDDCGGILLPTADDSLEEQNQLQHPDEQTPHSFLSPTTPLFGAPPEMSTVCLEVFQAATNHVVLRQMDRLHDAFIFRNGPNREKYLLIDDNPRPSSPKQPTLGKKSTQQQMRLQQQQQQHQQQQQEQQQQQQQHSPIAPLPFAPPLLSAESRRNFEIFQKKLFTSQQPLLDSLLMPSGQDSMNTPTATTSQCDDQIASQTPLAKHPPLPYNPSASLVLSTVEREHQRVNEAYQSALKLHHKAPFLVQRTDIFDSRCITNPFSAALLSNPDPLKTLGAVAQSGDDLLQKKQ